MKYNWETNVYNNNKRKFIVRNLEKLNKEYFSSDVEDSLYVGERDLEMNAKAFVWKTLLCTCHVHFLLYLEDWTNLTTSIFF